MLVRPAFVLVVLFAPLAVADPANDTREAAMMVGFEPLRADEVGLHASADAVLAAFAKTDGNDGKGGGAAAVSGQIGLAATPDCDLFALGGQIATHSDDRVVSLQQWATACPLGGDGNLTIDHRLEWDVTPRLLAAPLMRQGAQRRETVGFNVIGSERPWNPGDDRNVMQGGAARLGVEVGWGDGHPGEVRPGIDATLTILRHHYDDGPPLEAHLLRAGLEVLAPTGDPEAPIVATMLTELGSIQGVRFGGLRFGARVGGRLVHENKGDMKTYRQTLWLVGEGALSFERDLMRDVTVRLAGERRGWPLYDGRFAVDDRATGSISSRLGKLSGHLDVFAARDHLLSTDGRDGVTLKGVSANAEYAITGGFGVQLRSEFGLSAYTPGATFEDPRWASETLLSIAGHLEHRGGRR